MTLIIHAPNVHQGGGRALLVPVLEATKSLPCIAILDARLDLQLNFPLEMVVRVPPSLLGRLLAEWHLKRFAKAGDVVLCFGNLPPLFRISGHVRVFLQNRFLFGQRDLAAFGWRTRLRLMVERLWLRVRLKMTMQVFVQTPTMARELAMESGIKARVLPFVSVAVLNESGGTPRRFDFIYVASGEPHKNHHNLIEAWKLLAKEGLYPTLCLTLDHDKDHRLVSWVESAVRTAYLRIENVGFGSRTDIDQHYRDSAALIYPSTLESFGLPLLEAAAAKLPILAAELDYVRDVCVPVQTFDPLSPVSIARAVKRHLGLAESSLRPMSPSSFLQAVLEQNQ